MSVKPQNVDRPSIFVPEKCVKHGRTTVIVSENGKMKMVCVICEPRWDVSKVGKK